MDGRRQRPRRWRECTTLERNTASDDDGQATRQGRLPKGNVRKDHVNSQVDQCTNERDGGDIAEAAKVYELGDVAWRRWKRSKHCVMENVHVAHLW